MGSGGHSAHTAAADSAPHQVSLHGEGSPEVLLGLPAGGERAPYVWCIARMPASVRAVRFSR